MPDPSYDIEELERLLARYDRSVETGVTPPWSPAALQEHYHARDKLCYALLDALPSMLADLSLLVGARESGALREAELCCLKAWERSRWEPLAHAARTLRSLAAGED